MQQTAAQQTAAQQTAAQQTAAQQTAPHIASQMATSSLASVGPQVGIQTTLPQSLQQQQQPASIQMPPIYIVNQSPSVSGKPASDDKEEKDPEAEELDKALSEKTDSVLDTVQNAKRFTQQEKGRIYSFSNRRLYDT